MVRISMKLKIGDKPLLCDDTRDGRFREEVADIMPGQAVVWSLQTS